MLQTIETTVETKWTPIGPGRWEKRETESTVRLFVQRSGAWLNIETRGGVAGYKAQYGYNLREKRWSYNEQPPTDRILHAAIRSLDQTVSRPNSND